MLSICRSRFLRMQGSGEGYYCMCRGLVGDEHYLTRVKLLPRSVNWYLRRLWKWSVSHPTSCSKDARQVTSDNTNSQQCGCLLLSAWTAKESRVLFRMIKHFSSSRSEPCWITIFWWRLVLLSMYKKRWEFVAIWLQTITWGSETSKEGNSWKSRAIDQKDRKPGRAVGIGFSPAKDS